MTQREKLLLEQKEKARLMSNLVFEFNDYANYFDEDMKNCYVDVLNFVASGNKVKYFKSTEYNSDLLEEVLDNTSAYFSSFNYKHSELYYYTQELLRLRKERNE